jgi:hypothetical protein
MKKRIILDLCGGTGAWSQPYREAKYDVRIVTLPETDVRDYVPPQNVWGILAAPPCTEFARCGARWWRTKAPHLLTKALAVVTACLRIVEQSQCQWWALENPVGRLQHWLGPPVFKFQPWEFGDPWTKQTWLWGQFHLPMKLSDAKKPTGLSIPGHRSRQHLRFLNTLDFQKALELGLVQPDWIHKLPPSEVRSALRSITPPRFARAFFEANP